MITIVVGAQYGGEGKGKICAFLQTEQQFDVACRCGGPNSSHTVVYQGKEFRLRMMPTAAVVNPNIKVVFGAGALIHIPTLIDEMAAIEFRGEVIVDGNAGVVTSAIVQEQRRDARYEAIGSTLTGTGLATALRAQRKLLLAKDFPELRCFIRKDVGLFLHQAASKQRVLVEGHQGYGLSNYHGDYPFTSSRDSTSSAMLSELGLGPKPTKQIKIVLAVKVFPTRNHAGPLDDEMSVEDADVLGIKEHGGGAWGIPNKRRRVGVVDMSQLRGAVVANSPTEIALTGADYLDKELRSARQPTVSHDLESVVAGMQDQFGIPVRYVSTGPDTLDMIVRAKPDSRKHRQIDFEFPRSH